MRGYIAFVKKEFMEFTRTHKLLIIMAVFLLFGMMNPLTAKLTPLLVENFMPEGMNIEIPVPSAIDSWMQFYKNVPQLGLIVLVVLFSGIMAGEYSKGTLINILTKGLPRRTVILSKLTVAWIMWTGAYILCTAVSWGYTAALWKGDQLNHLAIAAVCLWTYGLLLIASVMLGGVLFRNTYGGLLFTGGVVLIQALINIAPKIADYNPLSLATRNMELINGTIQVSDLGIPMAVAGGLIIVFTWAAIVLFNRSRV